MDYSLGAIKVQCSELKHARQSDDDPLKLALLGILFQRAWIQGVLVSDLDEGTFFIDDGSDVVKLIITNEPNPSYWKKGMYVMVVGLYAPASENDFGSIKVHKIVDLSPYPDREAMWHLEVIEAHRLFYMPPL